MNNIKQTLPSLLREKTSLRNEHVWYIILQGLFVGGGGGAVIGLFRRLYDTFCIWLAGASQNITQSWEDIFVMFLILGIAAIIVGMLVRYEPLISGSGIPHVELVLADKAPFPWFRVVASKFIGTLISLSGGLSVGREGPSIQMGAAVGVGFGELFQRLSGKNIIHLPRFVIAGSVAGMTAAFGAPLAGMLFAFEELRTLITVPLLLFTASAACSAWFVVDKLFGFGLVFPFADIDSLPFASCWLVLPIGIATGLFGALYNAAMLKTTLFHDRQTFVPAVAKPLFPFFLSGILFFAYPQVMAGVGYSMSQLGELDGTALALNALGILLAVKVIFSILSFASGVPGGLLMPMLFIGGMFGAYTGTIIIHCGWASSLPVFLVLGMTGLFAGTVRAPLTGTALVAEMCGSFQCMPEMLAVAFIASFVANKAGSPPVYKSLKSRMYINIKRKK